MNGGQRISVLRSLIPKLLFVCPVLSFLVTQAEAARVVEEKRECAICHIAWLPDFKKEETETLVPHNPRPNVATGRQDVVSTEKMCFSCHDGFVLDSRFLWQEGGHTHPVGVVPSDKVLLPKEEGKTIFPLNDDGKVYCGTCHSAHGVEWGSKLSPVFLRKENVNSSLCMTCHVEQKKQHGTHPLHKHVTKNRGELSKIGAKFKNVNEIICQTCHKIHGSEEEKLLVKKNDRSQLCETCHVDKKNTGSSASNSHFTHPVSVIPENVKISAIFAESGSKFGPQQEITCQSCHRPHSAPSDKLLVLDEKHLERGICVMCHEKQGSLLATGHNLLGAEPGLIPDSEMPSRNLGACGVCHNIHGGEGPKMWARKLKPEGDRVAALCLSCHADGKIAQKHQVGDFSHPVGKSPGAGIDPGALPLFTVSGVKTHSTQTGRVSCPTCHDVHGSGNLVAPAESADGKKSSGGKYLRKGGEEDYQPLCKTCHEDKWSILKTKHELKGHNEDHLPLGVCGNCHQVHNGNGPRMWARAEDYAAAEYGTMCTGCHRKGGLAEDKTTGVHSHPIGVSIEATGIEVTDKGWVSSSDGNKTTTEAPLPLYAPGDHVTEGKNGRVSCPSCHDPHIWTAKTQDRDTGRDKAEEGDATSSFLRIPAAPHGELCLSCHQAKEPVLATDHDLAITAPNATNALGERPHQSGTCGQCHAVHNALQELALWARQPGKADNAPEKLCRSCHDSGEVAENKAPKKASHPAYVMAWDGKLRDADKQGASQLPVFSESGDQADTGYISCPTCHNVHQWRPGSQESGSGKNEEGDVFSSFLRTGSSEGILCADCHDLDSIFRYKYFHGIDFTAHKNK